MTAPSATLAPVPEPMAQVRYRKELQQPVKIAAAKAGLTVEAYVSRAIEAQLARDGERETKP